MSFGVKRIRVTAGFGSSVNVASLVSCIQDDHPAQTAISAMLEKLVLASGSTHLIHHQLPIHIQFLGGSTCQQACQQSQQARLPQRHHFEDLWIAASASALIFLPTCVIQRSVKFWVTTPAVALSLSPLTLYSKTQA